ncbi:MAG: hypothetical protein DRI97_04460, partial [Bacteroidetes bacterium]
MEFSVAVTDVGRALTKLEELEAGYSEVAAAAEKQARAEKQLGEISASSLEKMTSARKKYERLIKELTSTEKKLAEVERKLSEHMRTSIEDSSRATGAMDKRTKKYKTLTKLHTKYEQELTSLAVKIKGFSALENKVGGDSTSRQHLEKKVATLKEYERELKAGLQIQSIKNRQTLSENKAVKKLIDSKERLLWIQKQLEKTGDMGQLKQIKGLIGTSSTLDKAIATGAFTKTGQMNSKELEQFIVDATKAEKKLRRLDKAARKASRGVGFMNSKFDKLSIVMSGTAATIFVFQNIIRGLTAVVTPFLDIEKAFIKMKLTVGATSEEIENYKKTATDAARAGYQSTDKNIERMMKLREEGYNAAQAMVILKREMDRYSEASEGTASGGIAETFSLLKELATITFDKFLDSFNWLIAIINKGLRSLITSVDDLDNSTSSSGGKVPSTSTHVAMSGSAQAYGWGGNIPGGYGSEVGTNNSGRISMGGAAQAYGWSGNIPGQSTDQMAEFFIIFKKHMNETIDGLINASKAMDAASASMEEAARKTAEDKVTFLSSIEGFKKIEKVIDGDTMKIKVGDEELSVRIRAIDTPESVDPLKRETNRYNDP